MQINIINIFSTCYFVFVISPNALNLAISLPGLLNGLRSKIVISQSDVSLFSISLTSALIFIVFYSLVLSFVLFCSFPNFLSLEFISFISLPEL